MFHNGEYLSQWILPLVCLLLCIVQSVATLGLGESCVTPDKKPGKCIYITDCKPIMRLYKTILSPEDVLFVKRSQCERLQPEHPIKLVCCEDTSGLLPEPPNCGVQRSNPVSRNQTTKIDEFPWTVLLIVQMTGGNYGFNCAGTLINNRYVLTAARCVTSLSPGWKVNRVRLGEWDLYSNNDCENSFCNNAHIDVEIKKIIVHNDYSPQNKNRHNDIALIRLARQIEYSSSIRPICLPPTSWSHPPKYANMYSVGWGIASKKIKMERNVAALKNCGRFFGRDGISLKSSQMCTSPVRLNDTCSANMGGPLMREQRGLWYMYGVASILNCGKNGVPDVYTNVVEYAEWIRDNVKNSSRM